MGEVVAKAIGRELSECAVYGREGEPCRACGTSVKRVVQGQRSTFFCPNCQKR